MWYRTTIPPLKCRLTVSEEDDLPAAAFRLERSFSVVSLHLSAPAAMHRPATQRARDAKAGREVEGAEEEVLWEVELGEADAAERAGEERSSERRESKMEGLLFT